jgi:hypothetical protein
MQWSFALSLAQVNNDGGNRPVSERGQGIALAMGADICFVATGATLYHTLKKRRVAAHPAPAWMAQGYATTGGAP